MKTRTLLIREALRELCGYEAVLPSFLELPDGAENLKYHFVCSDSEWRLSGWVTNAGITQEDVTSASFSRAVQQIRRYFKTHSINTDAGP